MAVITKCNLPYTIRRKRPQVAALVVCCWLLGRMALCWPKYCGVLPGGSSWDLGVRMPRPLVEREFVAGSEEAHLCAELNALEVHTDAALRPAGADTAAVVRQQFNVLRDAYSLALHMWRVDQRAHPNSQQARCRAEKMATDILAAGRALPEKFKHQKSEETAWGQYAGLMVDLGVDLNKQERCESFDQVATWIWQWCSFGCEFPVIIY